MLDGTIIEIQDFLKWTGINGNRWKKSVLFCRSVVDKITYAKVVSNEKRKEKVLKTLLKASRLLTFSMGVGD